MLPPENSPLHRLILPWWQAERRPTLFQAQAMREALFAAALQEILDHHTTLKKSTDPTRDPRFKWAIQHLELIEGDRHAVDEDIRLTASVYLDPVPFLSRKDLAAGAA